MYAVCGHRCHRQRDSNRTENNVVKRRNILFGDEKIFNIENALNQQNNRVYGRSFVEARETVGCVQWRNLPASVISGSMSIGGSRSFL